MPGIYIHIPFCRQACHYCDFHFSTSLKATEDLLQALLKEIALQKEYLGTKKISTVYFGGGTPSLLSKDELDMIFTALKKNFEIDADAEMTLEANPDDLTKEKLGELSQTPVNRLSIGIQSFSDEDLSFLNRSHDSKAARTAVQDAQQAGFRNITIDLIYGIQTLSDVQWKKNLDTAFALDVQHISSYSLTVEPKTPLASFIQKGTAAPVDPEKSARHFEMLMDEMSKHGFIHYEISNFGKPDFFSRHNCSYWKGEKYLGLGPSAHSFDGETRQWNVKSNAAYITSLKENKVPFEKEILDDRTQYNEYVLTGLRTMWGVDTKYIRDKFPARFLAHFIGESAAHLAGGLLIQRQETILLSAKGKLFADKIASDLFLV